MKGAGWSEELELPGLAYRELENKNIGTFRTYLLKFNILFYNLKMAVDANIVR